MWDILNLWNQLKTRVDERIKVQTANCIRMRRYDVVSAAANGYVEVCLPFGSAVVKAKTTAQTENAQPGDTVLVLYTTGSSGAVAFCMGSGPE